MNSLQRMRLDKNCERIIGLELWLIGELELTSTVITGHIMALRARLNVMEAINNEREEPPAGGEAS